MSPATNPIQGSGNTPSPDIDIKAMRQRARQGIENGAVTKDYEANKDVVIRLLNEALATEIVCVLRYRLHHFMATGILSEPVAAEFLEHAVQEQEHADSIATRIVQLGGKPDFNPQTLVSRSHAEYVEVDSLADMIKENLVAERIAIESYRAMVNYIGDKDTTTRRMLEEILAVEEEHAEDLSSLMQGMPK
jgi:bacterioferritin